jgi:hypothetical protein
LFVKKLLESAKQTHVKVVNRKEPLNAEVLINICNEFKNSKDILIVRDLCIIHLGFSGFLRFDEFSPLKCNDVKCFEDNMSPKILINIV